MKKILCTSRKTAVFVACLCAVALASSYEAQAKPVSLPQLSILGIGNQHELGTVSHGIPEGDPFIPQYVNAMIGLSLGGSTHVTINTHDNLVSRSMNNFGPLPGPATLALRGTGTTIDLGLLQGTYAYLFAHYGGPHGGTVEVWFIGDLADSQLAAAVQGGVINIPQIGFGHGLSGWALFTAGEVPGVPDGGATVMLLGAALGVLGVTRRWLIRRT